MLEFDQFETIYVTLAETGVCTLTLNRPQVHNAFDELMIGELTNALEQLEKHQSVRILLVRGTGKSFSAGADLKWMQRMADYSEEQNFEDARRLATMMDKLYRIPKPTVAIVHGGVYGGAVGLVACCDIAIAADSAVFSLSEVKIGLIPAVISPYVVKAIGLRAARRYFLTGEVFNASTAQQIGLIHEYGHSDEIPSIESGIVERLRAGAPGAQQIAKSVLQNVLSEPVDSEMQDETSKLIARVRASEEGKEGIAAFLNKRSPAWRKSQSD